MRLNSSAPKKSDTILYATCEDTEFWHYEDPVECAQDAYDDGREPEDGHIRIFAGTVDHYEPRDFIGRQGVQAMIMDACDNHDQSALTDALDSVPPELFDPLAEAIAAAFAAWCATLPHGMNPLRAGRMVGVRPHLVPMSDIDQT